MSNAISAVLASLVGSYAETPAPCKVVELPSKKVVKASPSYKPSTLPAPTVQMLLPKGSLSAEDFLIAIRNAGKRVVPFTNLVTGEVSSKTIYDASLVRDDTIQAIAGFVGYDMAGNFGSQEHAARMAAKRVPIVHSAPIKEYSRSVQTTLTGYVAGMPTRTSQKIQNLLARETLAAEQLTDHHRQAAMALTPESREFHKTLAKVEVERIAEIRKALKELGA